jgi:hypothetical protein
VVLTSNTLNGPGQPRRQAGKFGRLPGYVPNGLRDLTWYVAGALPRPPLSVVPPVPSSSPDGTAWGMYGNDAYGDCGVAGVQHGDMAVDLAAKTALAKVTDDQVVQYYLKYTGGEDQGVVLADFLAYVKKAGWFGHKLAAYAPVAISDFATLRFAINAYGYSYAGIAVTDLMMQAFQEGQPWTAATFQDGNVEGGHCVPLVGYDSQNLYAVTWGGIQAIEYSAWHLMSSEAWACIWGEIPQSGLHGVNLKALQADLGRLVS